MQFASLLSEEVVNFSVAAVKERLKTDVREEPERFQLRHMLLACAIGSALGVLGAYLCQACGRHTRTPFVQTSHGTDVQQLAFAAFRGDHSIDVRELAFAALSCQELTQAQRAFFEGVAEAGSGHLEQLAEDAGTTAPRLLVDVLLATRD